MKRTVKAKAQDVLSKSRTGEACRKGFVSQLERVCVIGMRARSRMTAAAANSNAVNEMSHSDEKEGRILGSRSIKRIAANKMPKGRKINMGRLYHRCERSARDETSRPRFSEPGFTIHDQRPAQQHFFGESGKLPALEQIVIRTVVTVGAAVFQLSIRIPDDEIGIRTRLDSSFARVEAEYLGGIGAREGDELSGGNAARIDPMSPKEGQPIPYNRQSVRYLGEIACTQFLAGDGNLPAFILDGGRAIKEKGAVVGGDNLQLILFQSIPNSVVVGRRA
jgi:hypothetical protein